jgi:hypothetical protein
LNYGFHFLILVLVLVLVLLNPTTVETESSSDEGVLASGTTLERVLGMDLGAAQPPMRKQCEAKRRRVLEDGGPGF